MSKNKDMIDSLDENEVKGNLIEIRYIPLSAFKGKYDPNKVISQLKLHDIGAISKSILEYGFQDPPKWDESIDGFVYGNGRTEAAIAVLVELKEQGSKPPIGIGITSDGEWCIPCKFGADLDRNKALAFTIDHNNLTMAGGIFTSLDMGRMWDTEEYSELLESLAINNSLPVSVDGDDLDLLLDQLSKDFEDDLGNGDEPDRQDPEPQPKAPKEHKCPNCGHTFTE